MEKIMNHCKECKEFYYIHHICRFTKSNVDQNVFYNMTLRLLDEINQKIDQLKKDKPNINFGHGTIMSAGMSMGSEFGSHPVYWIGKKQGDYYVVGPDKVLGNDSGYYQMPNDNLMYTTMSSVTPYVYFTKEEAEKKLEELKSRKCKWGE